MRRSRIMTTNILGQPKFHRVVNGDTTACGLHSTGTFVDNDCELTCEPCKGWDRDSRAGWSSV